MLHPVQAHIISIGTELTAGLTVDTNAAWLAKRLAAVGFVVDRHVTVSDNQPAISDVIISAAAHADIVLITGGLGPTADDLTREALAGAAERPLVLHRPSFDQLSAYFQKIERAMPDTNRRQAYMPEGADVIDNARGTAPGIRLQIGSTTVFALPGVPSEMRAMFRETVEPELRGRSAGSVIVTGTLRCFGMGEARLGEMIEDLMTPGCGPLVGVTAADAIISVHVTARGANSLEASAAADDTLAVLRDRLGSLIFAEKNETLQQAVATLLIERKNTVATAESCTGGLLAKKLTDVPGSSAYFLGGFVTYADEAKTSQLGISPEAIAQHGAVSEEVAALLAEACRSRLNADFGLATTGIAGPTGGSAEKPVGLVYIAVATKTETVTRRLLTNAELGRDVIRQRSCNAILNLLRRHLISDVSQRV